MTSFENDCGVARRTDCNPATGRRTRAVQLEASNDPFAMPTAYLPTPLRSSRAFMVLGSWIPWTVFIVLLTLFTFAYAHVPVIVWLTVVFAADAALVGTWPPKGGQPGFRMRERSDWLPLFVGLFAVGAGVFCGTINSDFVEPWVRVKYLQRHVDVDPTSSPLPYADSGVLSFKPGSRVDIDASSGYLAWPHTYCAAPIRGPDSAGGAGGAASAAGGGSASGAASAGGAVSASIVAPMANASSLGFFAVGLNCCDSRGGFSCGDASNPDAVSGMRLDGGRLSDGKVTDTDYYFRAARMAAAANGESAAPALVLVLWQRDPEAAANTSWYTALGIYLGLVVASALFFALSRRLLRKYSGANPPGAGAAARAAAAAARWNALGKGQ